MSPAVRSYGSQLVDGCNGSAVRQEFVRCTHAQLALGDPEPRCDLCWGRHFRVGPALSVPCLPRALSSADLVRSVALGGGSGSCSAMQQPEAGATVGALTLTQRSQGQPR